MRLRLRAAESSFHALRIFLITVWNRGVHVRLKKRRCLVRGVKRLHIANSIRPQEYSRGGGMDDVSHISAQSERQPVCGVLQLERQHRQAELQLARQQPQRRQPVRSARNPFHFPTHSRIQECVGFCFFNCPCQPPSILPTSSILSERMAYFFVSSDFVSQRTMMSNFNVSTLRTARRT